ncbi:MAG: OmpA family protein, partial [Paracoccaceae bacterium]|nr:OmpA family protein [Paracoccaceae bacterium]
GLMLEIGGHTDAQGSVEGNRALSQARAEAVLLALQGRRVQVAGLTAVGYGEDHPLVDNATEAGREANRRIEFTLIDADDVTDEPVAPDAAVPDTAEPGTAEPAPSEAATQDAGAAASGDGVSGPEPADQPAPDAAHEPGLDAANDHRDAATPDVSAPDFSAPDFSTDDSPSVAPETKTRRARKRPAQP